MDKEKIALMILLNILFDIQVFGKILKMKEQLNYRLNFLVLYFQELRKKKMLIVNFGGVNITIIF